MLSPSSKTNILSKTIRCRNFLSLMDYRYYQGAFSALSTGTISSRDLHCICDSGLYLSVVLFSSIRANTFIFRVVSSCFNTALSTSRRNPDDLGSCRRRSWSKASCHSTLRLRTDEPRHVPSRSLESGVSKKCFLHFSDSAASSRVFRPLNARVVTITNGTNGRESGILRLAISVRYAFRVELRLKLTHLPQ